MFSQDLVCSCHEAHTQNRTPQNPGCGSALNAFIEHEHAHRGEESKGGAPEPDHPTGRYPARHKKWKHAQPGSQAGDCPGPAHN